MRTLMPVSKYLLIVPAFIFHFSFRNKTTDTFPALKKTVAKNQVDFWITKPDESAKLQKQNSLSFDTSINHYPVIDVDETSTFQTIDGFGFTLTGGSAEVINSLNSATKKKLLNELFSNEEGSVAISYLRLSIGASDLNDAPFSYDDMPSGQTDVNLSNFNLQPDMKNLVPLLKEILAIDPKIKLLATPWSAPVWMKDNNSFIGGSLLPEYYKAYAQYFVKYLQAMKEHGITIDAITPQNEPLNPNNNPSLVMTAGEQTDFIKNNLGPAFKAAGLNTKIIIYDHNCDRPDYPISVLNDASARAFINGSAFHLYAGDISALAEVKKAYPDKDLYFTEQYTPSTGTFAGDLKWHLKNVIIGSMRNWSRVALEWNLANNSSFGPHTDEGCTTCKGAITVESSSSYKKNVGYYIIAHVSEFVPPGSVRISSSAAGEINNVAFKTPNGKKVLVVENDENSTATFNIRYHHKSVLTSLPSGAVATYIW